MDPNPFIAALREVFVGRSHQNLGKRQGSARYQDRCEQGAGAATIAEKADSSSHYGDFGV